MASYLHSVPRRVWLTVRMTLAYEGRFPRRKVWRLYWQFAGDMVQSLSGVRDR